MFALMKPSNVATRSSTRGTSRGCTVVTRTSGAGGPAWGALREQLDANERTMSETAVHFAIVNNRGSAIGSFHSRDIIGKPRNRCRCLRHSLFQPRCMALWIPIFFGLQKIDQRLARFFRALFRNPVTGIF